MVLTESGGVALGSATATGAGRSPGEEGDEWEGLKRGAGVGLVLTCGASSDGGQKGGNTQPIIANMTVAPSASGRSAAASIRAMCAPPP